MMKNLTLFSAVIFSGSVAFGQSGLGNLPSAKLSKFGPTVEKPKQVHLATPKADGDTIWMDDFSNPSNWVLTDQSTPTHGFEFTTNLNASPVGALNPAGMPTAANGYVLCNSDAAGTQANPSQTDANVTTANPIDLTGFDNVTLQFYNTTRNWSSSYRVYVSGNNGGSWTEYLVNQHITTNVNTANPELVKLNISSAAANQSQVLIRFNFQAEWGWFWAIDDVSIIESPGHDIEMIRSVMSYGPAELMYSRIPSSQVNASNRMAFGSNVRNQGSRSQNLRMYVTNGAGANLVSDQLTLPSLASDTMSIPAASGWVVPSTVAVYDFTVDIDNDASSVGAVYTFDGGTLVGGSGYSDATGVATAGGSGTGLTVNIVTAAGEITEVTVNNPGTGYAVGDVVTIAGGTGGEIEINSIGNLDFTGDDSAVLKFQVTNNIMAVDTYDGTAASMNGGFFGWASATGDPGIGTIYEIFNAASFQRVVVGIANVATANQADYIGNEIFVQLFKFNPDLQEYEFVAISNTHQLAAANFGNTINLDFASPISANAGDVFLPVACFFEGSDAPVAFAGMSLAGTTLGLAGGDLVSLASDGPMVSAPVVRLNFANVASIEETALVSNNVVLYPNPTSNEATIAFTLNNDAAVSIEVRDLSGKVVYTSNEGQLAAGAHNTTLSTVSFASGMYTYSVSANGAVVTNKFIVKK
jgi:hypothetical protein